MPVVWDDTEILRVIDESRRNHTGVAWGGTLLMQEIIRRHDWQLDPYVDYGTFVRELLLAREGGLITYEEILWAADRLILRIPTCTCSGSRISKSRWPGATAPKAASSVGRRPTRTKTTVG
jgi:hypothetical protein